MPMASYADEPDDSDSDSDDPVLRHERAHLSNSREFLGLMRQDVLSLKAMGGDPVSEEFLKADLYHRAEALKDIPDVPLFFGRLDYAAQVGGQVGGPAEGRETGGEPASETVQGAGEGGKGRWAGGGESFHVGRRHVHSPDGQPAVIDWRAPVSRSFYRASRADPMGLALRRRFGFSGGDLTAYEDEIFAGTDTTPRSGSFAPKEQQVSRLLIEEIERPRSGPMRDIVATIQPEQDDIVRADASQTVCVQGAPGTGKTAVGLHRVAFLLYAYHDRVTRRGVLVIGPNRAFLSYIRDVLPALGELDVGQLTVGELVASVPVRGADSEAAAVVKGDARMAEVLRRALWAGITRPAEGLLLPRGSRRWRLAAYELEELAWELQGRGVRYGAGRELLAHRIAHVILTKIEEAGEACDDRTHDAVRRTRQVRAAVDAMWPKVDPVRLVFGVLSDPAVLGRAAAEVLSADEQAAVLWSSPPRGPGSARWSRADAVLIDEARDLIERTPSLAHVVVDEAQDLSPMEIRAIGRRCSTGAATVLGDLAQGTTPWAATSWAGLLAHLGKPEAELRELDIGYRVPRQILDFASRLLRLIAPGLSPAVSLREDAGALEIVSVPGGDLGHRLAAVCAEACGRAGSVAVIAADPQVAEVSRALEEAGLGYGVLDGTGPGEGAGAGEEASARLAVVPVTLAKGLEFDHVIVVEPARIAAAEAKGIQRLYVALTRAVSRLTVLHAEPLPDPLRLAVWSV